MFDFVLANYGSFLEIAFGVHAVAVAVVNLTPTPKDDAFVASAYRILEFTAGILSKRAKM